MDTSLESWIAQARESGLGDDEIRRRLKSAGWQDIQIDAYLGSKNPLSSKPIASAAGAQSSTGYLIGSDIWKRAWEATRHAMLQYLVIGGAGAVIAVALYYALFALMRESSSSFLLDVVAVCVMMIIFVFVFLVIQYSAVIIISYKTTSIRQALSLTIKKIFPFFLVGILSYFIVAGGTYVFFIPGILMALAFTLLPFVVAYENLSGFAALKRTYALAKGHRGKIFVALLILSLVYLGLFVLVWLISVGVTSGVDTMKSATAVTGGWVVALILLGAFYIFWPLFQTAYSYVLYTDIVATQPVSNPGLESRGKKLMLAYIVIFFLALILVFVSANSVRTRTTSTIDDVQHMSTVSSTYYDLMFYADVHDGAYPASLNEMQASDEFSLTAEELDFLTYSRSSDGSDFLLCAPLNTPQAVTEITNSYTSYYGLNKEIEDYCFTSYGQVDADGNRVSPTFD